MAQRIALIHRPIHPVMWKPMIPVTNELVTAAADPIPKVRQ